MDSPRAKQEKAAAEDCVLGTAGSRSKLKDRYYPNQPLSGTASIVFHALTLVFLPCTNRRFLPWGCLILVPSLSCCDPRYYAGGDGENR